MKYLLKIITAIIFSPLLLISIIIGVVRYVWDFCWVTSEGVYSFISEKLYFYTKWIRNEK